MCTKKRHSSLVLYQVLVTVHIHGCDFITYTYRLLIANVFWPETANI